MPRDERRALLLEAALGAFSEQGYHATSMDDIAERAGVSKPVLYQHFDSKLDLYLGLAGRVCDEVVAKIEGALASTTDNGERIEACLHGFFELVDRPGSGYQLVFDSDMGGQREVAALLDEARRRCAEAIGRVLQEQSPLTWDECVLLGSTLVGMAQSAARHWVESGSTIPRREAADLVAKLAWRGMGNVPHLPEGHDGTGREAGPDGEPPAG
ncbi:TetR/AcrR family transcriptional regulator [Ornithinimicrobium humiphilum]|jgi:AcrR family transcriptional regulator|uniref:TetR family transcriptional regulator n=1 Tax=Ornithinimicrobium humiphilum TaxID=125288 RepID=A0A543KR03_9MICO|nr:TetR/AcrR family transcriptional regulator [Ornithinimicrobium humiphilum]TQM97500.1 TetR family transcriptional regulator [Ornithinimicrobium humiphilum]